MLAMMTFVAEQLHQHRAALLELRPEDPERELILFEIDDLLDSANTLMATPIGKWYRKLLQPRGLM